MICPPNHKYTRGSVGRREEGRATICKCMCPQPGKAAAYHPSPQEKVDAWEEERRVSKYAEGLEQLPATKRIPMDPKQVQWNALCNLTCKVNSCDLLPCGLPAIAPAWSPSRRWVLVKLRMLHGGRPGACP